MTGPWTERTRRLAATDLSERATSLLRSGPAAHETIRVMQYAAEIVDPAVPLVEERYRHGLALLGLAPLEIDGAVAAALAGTTPHPLAALAERVEAYSKDQIAYRDEEPALGPSPSAEARHETADTIAGWIRELMPKDSTTP